MNIDHEFLGQKDGIPLPDDIGLVEVKGQRPDHILLRLINRENYQHNVIRPANRSSWVFRRKAHRLLPIGS